MIFRTFLRLQRRNREEHREGGGGGEVERGGGLRGEFPRWECPRTALYPPFPPPLSLSPSLMKIAQRQSLRSIIMRNSKVRIHIPDIPRQSESNVRGSMDYLSNIPAPLPKRFLKSNAPILVEKVSSVRGMPGVGSNVGGREGGGGGGGKRGESWGCRGFPAFVLGRSKYRSIQLSISHELNSLNLVRLLWCTNGPRSMI